MKKDCVIAEYMAMNKLRLVQKSKTDIGRAFRKAIEGQRKNNIYEKINRYYR